MTASTEYAAARFHMVEGQVRPNKVIDAALIAALSAVPREQFVPARLRGVAYLDEDIDIGGGRCLVQPMVLARLLEEARVQATDKVLVVGAGAGYAAAVLARIAARVVALESDAALAAQARQTLAALGEDRVEVVEGPLAAGWPAAAGYDVILIDGAAADLPAALTAQLTDGGRLVGVVRPAGRLGEAGVWQKIGPVVSGRTLFEAATPVLPELQPKPAFQF